MKVEDLQMAALATELWLADNYRECEAWEVLMVLATALGDFAGGSLAKDGDLDEVLASMARVTRAAAEWRKANQEALPYPRALRDVIAEYRREQAHGPREPS